MPDDFFMLLMRDCICIQILLAIGLIYSFIYLGDSAAIAKQSGQLSLVVALVAYALTIALTIAKMLISRRSRRLRPSPVVGVRIDGAQQQAGPPLVDGTPMG